MVTDISSSNPASTCVAVVEVHPLFIDVRREGFDAVLATPFALGASAPVGPVKPLGSMMLIDGGGLLLLDAMLLEASPFALRLLGSWRFKTLDPRFRISDNGIWGAGSGAVASKERWLGKQDIAFPSATTSAPLGSHAT